MKKIILSYFLFLVSFLSLAHPGIGIVIDSKGNIFYTDLKQIWKQTPEGEKTIVVPNVHSHELGIDANDNIYGEHLWYNGERLDTWGHFTWCLKSDGTFIKENARQGFLENYGFLRDSADNMYWIERFTVTKFKKKTPEGSVTTIAEGRFGNIRWSHCTKNGVLYFVDLNKLYKLTPDGKFILLAAKLDDGKLGFGFNRQHNVYGIWVDTKENVYVAIMPQKKVKRISPKGKVDVVAYSEGRWSPTSGLFDKDGNMWLLEDGGLGKCRVRKIESQKLYAKPNIHKPVVMNYVIAGTGFFVIALITFGAIKSVKFFKRKFS